MPAHATSAKAHVRSARKRSGALVRMGFARTPDGRIVSIDAVERGVASGCTCLHCGAPLIAKKGTETAHHFSHRTLAVDSCLVNDADIVRAVARQIVADGLDLLLPVDYLIAVGAVPLPGLRTDLGRSRERLVAAPPEPLLATVLDADVHVKGRAGRLGLIFRTGGTPTEPALSETRLAKAAAELESRGISGFVLDLSGLDALSSLDEIQDRIEQGGTRLWLKNDRLAERIPAGLAQMEARRRELSAQRAEDERERQRLAAKRAAEERAESRRREAERQQEILRAKLSRLPAAPAPARAKAAGAPTPLDASRRARVAKTLAECGLGPWLGEDAAALVGPAALPTLSKEAAARIVALSGNGRFKAYLRDADSDPARVHLSVPPSEARVHLWESLIERREFGGFSLDGTVIGAEEAGAMLAHAGLLRETPRPDLAAAICAVADGCELVRDVFEDVAAALGCPRAYDPSLGDEGNIDALSAALDARQPSVLETLRSLLDRLSVSSARLPHVRALGGPSVVCGRHEEGDLGWLVSSPQVEVAFHVMRAALRADGQDADGVFLPRLRPSGDLAEQEVLPRLAALGDDRSEPYQTLLRTLVGHLRPATA